MALAGTLERVVCLLPGPDARLLRRVKPERHRDRLDQRHVLRRLQRIGSAAGQSYRPGGRAPHLPRGDGPRRPCRPRLRAVRRGHMGRPWRCTPPWSSSAASSDRLRSAWCSRSSAATAARSPGPWPSPQWGWASPWARWRSPSMGLGSGTTALNPEGRRHFVLGRRRRALMMRPASRRARLLAQGEMAASQTRSKHRNPAQDRRTAPPPPSMTNHERREPRHVHRTVTHLHRRRL